MPSSIDKHKREPKQSQGSSASTPEPPLFVSTPTGSFVFTRKHEFSSLPLHISHNCDLTLDSEGVSTGRAPLLVEEPMNKLTLRWLSG